MRASAIHAGKVGAIVIAAALLSLALWAMFFLVLTGGRIGPSD